MSKNIWESMWLGQNRKCAKCGKFVSLDNTAKSGYSFKILCSKCYKSPSYTTIIMDEFEDYPEED
jgi:hypothetical protein